MWTPSLPIPPTPWFTVGLRSSPGTDAESFALSSAPLAQLYLRTFFIFIFSCSMERLALDSALVHYNSRVSSCLETLSLDPSGKGDVRGHLWLKLYLRTLFRFILSPPPPGVVPGEGLDCRLPSETWVLGRFRGGGFSPPPPPLMWNSPKVVICFGFAGEPLHVVCKGVA